MTKKINNKCQFSNICGSECEDNDFKKDTCEKCNFYQFIDSASGWCKALPIPVGVSWCKPICYFFSYVQKENLDD
jgi:hypothetical protein